MISSFLSKMGIISWASARLEAPLLMLSPVTSIIMLSLLYFYIHYFFASATTHIAVLFPTFLALFIQAGMPPVLSALALSFSSIISSGLTHYGLGSAPVFFGSGYMSTKTWWSLGLILSILYILIWAIAGSLWWKILGLW